MRVMVGLCVEDIYTPPPLLPQRREPLEHAYTSTIHFLWENHLLMCWDQDIPILPQGSWFLAFPSCFPLKSSFHHIQICVWERESWVLGNYHLKHKSKEFIINTTSITFWRMVSPKLVRCLLGASDKLWSWTKKFVRARRSPTSWKSTRVRQVLHGRWPLWDRQGCFFVAPSWTHATFTLGGLSINVDVR